MESRLLGFPATEYRSLALHGGSWALEPSCSNMGTVNGQYKKNLDELLSSLSKASPKNGVFRTSTVGTGVDQVRGSLMCFIDQDQTKCLDCLANITAWITRTCPNSRTASASYSACLLQYSSPPFFDSAKHTYGSDMNITFMELSPPFDGDMASMTKARSRLLEEISHKASNQTLRFYHQSRQYTADKQVMRVYVLVQCRGDLAPAGCSRCISGYNGILGRLFPNNGEGIVRGYNCFVRFQPSQISIFAKRMPPLLARTDPFLVLPPPYSPPSGPLPRLPLPPSYSNPRGQDSPLYAIAVVMVVGLVALSIMATLWWCWRKAMACVRPAWTPFPRRRSFSVQAPVHSVQLMSRDLETGPVEDPAQHGIPIPTENLEIGPKKFSYQELATATDNFANILGKGGFGAVYEGKLGDLKVAIKKLFNASQLSVDGYKAELTIISRLRHRNVVQLIGWCHDNNDLLLVYELMPKGSLDTHLHCANPVLPWSDRYKIALDLARALAYIHEDFDGDQFVLHKDIKPNNIMIGESLNAKLGDFGLARLVNHGQSAYTGRLAGTFGYMDPYSCGDVKSDMYSFGVVLLEMGSGLRPSTEVMGVNSVVEHKHISDLISREYSNGTALISADPHLQGNFLREQLDVMMHLGLRCVQSDPRMRPSAKQAIIALESAMPLEDFPVNIHGSSVPGLNYFDLPDTSDFSSDRSSITFSSSRVSSDRSREAVPSALLDSPSLADIHDVNLDCSTAALNNVGLSLVPSPIAGVTVHQNYGSLCGFLVATYLSTIPQPIAGVTVQPSIRDVCDFLRATCLPRISWPSARVVYDYDLRLVTASRTRPFSPVKSTGFEHLCRRLSRIRKIKIWVKPGREDCISFAASTLAKEVGALIQAVKIAECGNWPAILRLGRHWSVQGAKYSSYDLAHVLAGLGVSGNHW